MPYYIHLFDERGGVSAPTGREYPTIDEARTAAARTVVDLVIERMYDAPAAAAAVDYDGDPCAEFSEITASVRRTGHARGYAWRYSTVDFGGPRDLHVDPANFRSVWTARYYLDGEPCGEARITVPAAEVTGDDRQDELAAVRIARMRGRCPLTDGEGCLTLTVARRGRPEPTADDKYYEAA